MVSVSVFVSLCAFVFQRAYLENYTSNLYQIFVRVTYGRGMARSYVPHFRFVYDVTFAHNWSGKSNTIQVGRLLNSYSPWYWGRSLMSTIALFVTSGLMMCCSELD